MPDGGRTPVEYKRWVRFQKEKWRSLIFKKYVEEEVKTSKNQFLEAV